MSDMMATRDAYGKTLVKLGEKYPNLAVMDGDLSGSTKTKAFADAYPDRFFNMGIAEQNLYGAATGMALTGKVVCASTFAMFAAGRAFEIIRNSIGYTGANVKICATHAGITVGEDGASHQTFEDVALMRTIPGMTVLVPGDGVSAQKLIEEAVAMNGPVYVRLGRSKVPVIYDESDEIKIGKGKLLRDGGDITVVAAGIMVKKALDAADKLKEQGVNAAVVDMHTVKPLDEELILSQAEKTGKIVVAEEHSVIGGLGSAVAQVLAEKRPTKMGFVGQQDCYGRSGKPADLLKMYNMTADDIVKKCKSML